MSEQHERHGDAAAVFDCLKYHASAGGEYEYRGTMALEAFDRICTALLDIQAQRDELLAIGLRLIQKIDAGFDILTWDDEWDNLRAAIANVEARP